MIETHKRKIDGLYVIMGVFFGILAGYMFALAPTALHPPFGLIVFLGTGIAFLIMAALFLFIGGVK